MTSRYRHRRTFDPAIAFPSPVEPGEIIVNTSNRQIAVGDANAGQLGVPKALIGVRFFDTTARYALNDVVVQAGNLYKANATIPPGAFNGANWTQLGVVTTMPAGSVVFTPTGNVIAIDVQGAIAELDAEKVAKAGDTMAGHLSLPTSPNAANAVRKDYVDAADAALATLAGSKVDKGGDTMTGALVLPADPTIALHAATKNYVDANTGSALVVSDTPPAGAKDGSLWWESDSGLLYVRYNDGNTIQWVIAAPQPDINAFATHAYVDAGDLNALKYSAQSLTATQQQQARQNVYAAPFDAMAYSGLQINGGFDISQEKGAGNTAIGSGPAIYVMDGWYMSISTPGGVVVTGSQAAGYFAGFPKSLNLAVTTAQASIAATDLVLCQQLIEGYRIARLAWGTAQAQPLTISFWSAHHRPGIYSLVVRNPGGTRCYPVTYTQAVADVAQYNTVTIPGCTDGAWTADNTAGIMLLFTLACGSTYTSASNNNWLTTNTLAALGQINAVAATSDVFRITGVIVLPGNEAPVQTKSPFVMRAYQDELLICKRYFYNGILPLKGVTGGAQPWAQRMGFPHPVAMRASPTVIIPATISFLDGSQILQSAGVTTNYSTPLALEVDCQTNVVGVAGRAMVVSIGGSTGNITVDARL